MAKLRPYNLVAGKYVCLEYRTPRELAKGLRRLAKYFEDASPYTTLGAINIQHAYHAPDLTYLEVFVEEDEMEAP